MDDPVSEGWTDLIDRLRTLPDKVSKRLLIGWSAAQANRMAALLRPAVREVAFRTGRLTGSIIGKAVSSRKALGRSESLARAITFSSKRHGGDLFNPINSGTKTRTTKKSGANRGRVTPRRIIVGAAPHIFDSVLPDAQFDLAKRIERALAKHGGS